MKNLINQISVAIEYGCNCSTCGCINNPDCKHRCCGHGNSD